MTKARQLEAALTRRRPGNGGCVLSLEASVSRTFLASLTILGALAGALAALGGEAPTYPPTRRVDSVENHQGGPDSA
jgi:hypothetical protein